jgi:DNA-directed RNA polymerase specialized sigma54-like protein
MQQTQSQQMRPELRQVLRMEQARLLEMPEDEFQKLIAAIEQSALFQRLYRQEKLIRHQRSPRTDISPAFYELKEEMAPSKASADVESLLQDKEQLVGEIRRLGADKFKSYFLFPESGMTAEEIAAECGLAIAEVEKINRLIDQFAILGEFQNPAATGSGAVRYYKLATVSKEEEGFVIGYSAASLARGQYSINYQRFEELKAAGAFSETESRQARQLFKQMEMVNSRQDSVTRILQAIIDKQALYLDSGERKALLPFSQQELAKKVGLAPSSVSRAIHGKSIGTPWGEEVPLKNFFPRPRRFKKELLKQLLDSEEGPLSDEAIRARLLEKFGVAISRRSVADLRKEMKIPASRGRKRARNGEGKS